jgi:hypothetical protein
MRYPLELLYSVDPSGTQGQRVRAFSLESAYYIDTTQSLILSTLQAFLLPLATFRLAFF